MLYDSMKLEMRYIQLTLDAHLVLPTMKQVIAPCLYLDMVRLSRMIA